jgi:hypothetical protein
MPPRARAAICQAGGREAHQRAALGREGAQKVPELRGRWDLPRGELLAQEAALAIEEPLKATKVSPPPWGRRRHQGALDWIYTNIIALIIAISYTNAEPRCQNDYDIVGQGCGRG